MNIVLADTEEFRRRSSRPAKVVAGQLQIVDTEEKRLLGLTIIRGASIMGVSVEGPPPAEPSARLNKSGTANTVTIAPAPGVSRPAAMGRGVTSGLTGPAAGVGGPGVAFGPSPPIGGPPVYLGRGGPHAGPPRTFAMRHTNLQACLLSCSGLPCQHASGWWT